MAKAGTRRAEDAVDAAPPRLKIDAGTARHRAPNGRFQTADVRIVAEKRPVAKPKRVAAKRRAVRWTPRRQEIFLAALAETANIAGSARAAKVSETTVRRKRRESEDFRAAWEVALREGVAQLRMTLLDRALNGVKEPVWHGGKRVGMVTRFNDRLALALLTAHGGGREPAADEAPEESIEEMRERFKAELSEMNRRMGGAG